MASVQKCDHCNRLGSDVFYDDETGFAVCEDCRIQRADFAAHFDAEQPADDFQAHVASMEASISASWVEVERYHGKSLLGYGHFVHSYVYVVGGIVTRDYFVRDGEQSTDVNALISFVGRASWGLRLQSTFGFRKLPLGLWFNTMTGEYSAVNPLS